MWLKKESFFKKQDPLKQGGLKDVYYDPETGYCGMNELYRKTKLPKATIREFLHKQDEYTKHKPVVRKFKRRRIYVSHVDDQFQADLIDMSIFKKYNNNTNYILSVIDLFSKYAWAVPIKRKTGDEVTKAFQKIFKERVPDRLQSDKGTEFLSKTTQKLMTHHNIKWFTTENVEIKCSIVERFNRTLKTKMWKYFTANNTRRWIDVLDKLVKNYNNSYHRSIKMTPVEASKEENESIVYKNLFKPKIISKPKYKLNDRVRISKYKKEFRKGYLPTFTEEMFKISKVLETDPITYVIKDLNDEEIKGTFYEKELVNYNTDVYTVEKVIRKKGNKYLVKWLGYDDKFNSWVDGFTCK